MNTATKRILAAAAAIAAVLVLVWFFALYRPQSSDLKAAHVAEGAAESQISSLQAQIGSMQAISRQSPQDHQKLKALDAALPNNPDLADALGQLHKIAEATGSELTSVGPSSLGTVSTAAAPGGPPSVSLTMAVTGTYGQTVAFLTALDQMPRTVTVTHLALSASGTNLTAALTASIFYAQSGNDNASSPTAG